MAVGPSEDDRQMFAEELKAMRAKRGWSVDEVAQKIGFSKSTIKNIESASRAPTTTQAELLDEAFETPGTFARLERRMRGVPFSAGFRPFRPYEQEARTLKTFEHSVVPGLFQIREYAWALAERHPEATEDVVKERVDARMERQQILFRSDPPPPRVVAVLDEYVLRRKIADPAVMAAQLDHLAELARMPRIIIQVLPDQAHSGLQGAFVIAETDQPPAIVYLETALSGHVVEAPDMADETDVLFDALRAEALTGGASLNLIEEAAQRWKEQITP
jgi:transcriptional regulator with XRE-family HTH domain